jgi:putative zinc finger protein
MRCNECLPLLDQFVEGEFDDETAESLSAHVAACSACASAYETLRREQEIYASYLLDVQPPAALWDRFQLQLQRDKAITPSQPQFRLQRWLAISLEALPVRPQLAAALVLITIGLAIGIIVWRTTIDASRQRAQNAGNGVQALSNVSGSSTPGDSDNTDRRGSVTDNAGAILPSLLKGRDRKIQVSAARRAGRTMERSPGVPTVDQVARRTEQQYLSAIEILSRDIKRRRPGISRGLRSQLETALVDVDRNIAATRRVAREQPRDPFAVQYLALAYEKKIELLREVANW